MEDKPPAGRVWEFGCFLDGFSSLVAGTTQAPAQFWMEIPVLQGLGICSPRNSRGCCLQPWDPAQGPPQPGLQGLPGTPPLGSASMPGHTSATRSLDAEM